MRQAHAPRTERAGSDDAELIRRALDRDEAAVRAIMAANNRRLYRLARGILRSDAEAEDVVQETYVRAFTHLAGFRGESRLATWLARIAINEALGRLRQDRSALEHSLRGTAASMQRSSRFPLPRPTIRKNPWPNAKSERSSNAPSTNCRTASAWSSSPGWSKA
jgi:RNA polymerase sigma-70 factor (ECF subfamily)